MDKKPTLAAAIITFNEEENIEACCASLNDLVDEIIVLDSYSQDRTKEICERNPKVKFYQHPFDGHIQQKNRALQYCKTDWILSLDADERLSEELSRSISKFLGNNPKEVGAKFPRLNYHMHRFIRYGGWYPNARYRLIRNGCAHWGGENPHDTIILNGPGAVLKGNLIHYSCKDLADQVKTINQFSSIVALTRYNKGKSTSWFRLLFKPLSKYMEIYFLKRGMLDGLQGFVIAVSSAYSTFLKEAKLWELTRLGSDKPSNLSGLYKKELERSGD